MATERQITAFAATHDANLRCGACGGVPVTRIVIRQGGHVYVQARCHGEVAMYEVGDAAHYNAIETAHSLGFSDVELRPNPFRVGPLNGGLAFSGGAAQIELSGNVPQGCRESVRLAIQRHLERGGSRTRQALELLSVEASHLANGPHDDRPSVGGQWEITFDDNLVAHCAFVTNGRDRRGGNGRPRMELMKRELERPPSVVELDRLRELVDGFSDAGAANHMADAMAYGVLAPRDPEARLEMERRNRERTAVERLVQIIYAIKGAKMREQTQLGRFAAAMRALGRAVRASWQAQVVLHTVIVNIVEAWVTSPAGLEFGSVTVADYGAPVDDPAERYALIELD